MEEKIIIIGIKQFGYLTDTYKYCQNLNNKFKITYISADVGLKRIESSNITTIYVPYQGLKVFCLLKLILTSIVHIWKHSGQVFIVYFTGCVVIKLFSPWGKKIILDIRTLSVDKNVVIRNLYNLNLKFSCLFFNKITAISHGVISEIHLSRKTISLLPVGSDIISKSDKKFNNLHLFYIGTLSNRDILKTIIGFSQFYEKYSGIIQITYDIVGRGNQEVDIERTIRGKNLSNAIKLYGYLPHEKCRFLFDHCNIGVSFVPITSYYQSQPPTKTFEYILSGMLCIATSTDSNKEIINSKNGILIEDNAAEFCRALELIFLNKDHLNSKEIRETLVDYQWHNIVDKYLLPILAH